MGCLSRKSLQLYLLTLALPPLSKRKRTLAVQCAEKQLRDGTASSQVITHYLKLGSSKERIEKEILEKQKELIEAKTKNLNSNSEAKELYNKALEAFRRYSGAGGEDDEY